MLQSVATYEIEVKAKRMNRKSSMFLVLPVPFRKQGEKLYFEAQACNGVHRWADHFSRLVVAAPLLPEKLAESSVSIAWRPVEEFTNRNVVCVPLPWAHDVPTFVRTYRQTRKVLGQNILDSNYLQFAIGGLVGDWAAVAALEAYRQGKRFAIHTDRVEHEVLKQVTRDHPFPRRMKSLVSSRLMEIYHGYVIKRCSLGLWHGSDCFDAYSKWCRESHLIHDVHTRQADCISNEALEAKISNLRSCSAVRICYAGRLDAMKAPLEWLKAIAIARDLGAPITAAWYGDGTLREQAERETRRLRLSAAVSLRGFVTDRSELLSALRSSHIMAFTHVTPESPRCLLEALISGTPIVGYAGRYAKDLTRGIGGGRFTALHDWEALGRELACLCSNRNELETLTRQAAENGKRFSDSAVFAERSSLVKQFC